MDPGSTASFLDSGEVGGGSKIHLQANMPQNLVHTSIVKQVKCCQMPTMWQIYTCTVTSLRWIELATANMV